VINTENNESVLDVVKKKKFIKNIYYPALKITIEVIMTFSIGSLCYAIFCKTNRAAFLPISVVLFLLTLYLMGG